MRRKSVLLFCLLTMGIVACQDSEEKTNLVRTWQYDLPAIQDEMRSRKADQRSFNYMESIMAGLQFAQLTFNADGSLLLQLDDFAEKGNWKLRRNGKELLIQFNDQPQRSRIDLISSDTLMLTPMDENAEINFPRVLVAVDTLAVPE